jgi:hypothetical protein
MQSTDHTAATLPDRGARLAIILLGLLSGEGLLLLHRATGSGFDSPVWLTLLYTQLIAVPLILALLLRELRDKAAWFAGLAYALLLLPLALHTGGALVVEKGYFGNGGIHAHYCAALLAASFILVPFVQARRIRSLHYPALFDHAWNNALALAVAAVFTLAAWLVLELWQALFALLGIAFFERQFELAEFAYPVTGLLAGVGLMLGRTQAGAIRVVLNVCLLLGRALFVPVAVLALVFLATLACNNIGRLWETRHASALILTLLFTVVALLNALYQDGQHGKAGPFLRRLSGAVLLTLPIYAAIAAWALALRIDQHGWSEERLWACLACLAAALYALSYAAAVLARRQAWLALVGPANAWIALFIAAVLLLTQSPLLDFRRIAVHSQVARALRQGGDPTRLDLAYLRFEGGRPGDAALHALLQDSRTAALPLLRAAITRELSRKYPYAAALAELPVEAASFTVLPAGTPVPEGLLALLRSSSPPGQPWQFETSSCVEHPGECVLFKLDLGPPAPAAWVVIGGCANCRLPVFAEGPDGWKYRGVLTTRSANHEAVVAALKGGHFSTQPSPWLDLVLEGGPRYRFEPND